MAEALFNLDRDQEALDALQRMVNRATDPYEALPLAAEVAFRYKKFSEAVQYRTRLVKLNPEATENRIELARAQAADADTRSAVKTIAAVLADRKTSSELIARASELLPEFVIGDKDEALAQLPADSRVVPARAALLRGMGYPEQARRALEPSRTDRYNVLARIERALLEQTTGSSQMQLKAWEETLFVDPDEAIANSMVFATNTPRTHLIRLYPQVKRFEAALQIAEGLPDMAPSREESLEENEQAPAPTKTETTEDGGSLRTLEQRNTAAKTQQRIEALANLAQAAKELGDYERALSYLQTRLGLLRDEAAIAAAKQAMAALKAEKEHQERQAMQRMTITKNEVHLGARVG